MLAELSKDLLADLLANLIFDEGGDTPAGANFVLQDGSNFVLQDGSNYTFN